jgi:hypothetical protein
VTGVIPHASTAPIVGLLDRAGPVEARSHRRGSTTPFHPGATCHPNWCARYARALLICWWDAMYKCLLVPKTCVSNTLLVIAYAMGLASL